MPKHVDVPGVGLVEFPDEMDDNAISQVIQKQHPELKPPVQNVGKMSGNGMLDRARNFLVSGDASKPYDKNTGGYKPLNVPDNLIGNMMKSPGEGMEDIGTGARQVMNNEKLKGANSLFKGAAKVGVAALPGAAAAAPFKTALGLAGGMAGNVIGNVGTSLFSDDPDVQELGGNIGSVVGGVKGFHHGTDVSPEYMPEFVHGAVDSAKQQVRPVLDKFSLWHPLKNIGTMYDAAKNTMEGGSDAVKRAQGDTSLPDPGDMPQAGKVKQQMMGKTPQSRPVQSRGNNRVVGKDPGNMSPSAANFIDSEEGSSNVEKMNNIYKNLGSLSTSSEPSTITSDFPSARKVPQGMAASGPETHQVQPAGGERPQGPGTAPKAPSAFSTSDWNLTPEHKQLLDQLKYFSDRNNELGYKGEDIKAPEVKTEPPDIHNQIAMEGLQKRAADSRAKYEDVYQNVIKGNYTPEELRNMTPEQQTQIDMKIKALKHPEGHPSAGKKKYGTGLNPAVVESLASRLESESQ